MLEYFRAEALKDDDISIIAKNVILRFPNRRHRKCGHLYDYDIRHNSISIRRQIEKFKNTDSSADVQEARFLLLCSIYRSTTSYTPEDLKTLAAMI
jgi:hypothetical protein